LVRALAGELKCAAAQRTELINRATQGIQNEEDFACNDCGDRILGRIGPAPADLARPVYKAALRLLGLRAFGGSMSAPTPAAPTMTISGTTVMVGPRRLTPSCHSVRSNKSGFIGRRPGRLQLAEPLYVFGIEADYAWSSITNSTFNTDARPGAALDTVSTPASCVASHTPSAHRHCGRQPPCST